MGRTAAGVMGIRLNDGDVVKAFDVVEPEATCSSSPNGYGKRTPLDQFTRTRNTQGMGAGA